MASGDSNLVVRTLQPAPRDVASTGREDAGWVQALKKGDSDAIAELAHQEVPRVERLLRRLLGPRKDMEDLVQDVFVELFKSLPSFRGESRVSTFVGGITVRVARRAMRSPAWVRKRGAMPDQLTSPNHNPEAALRRNAALELLHRALEGLAPKKRVAFVLWSLEGMSPAEIGEVTGHSKAAVRSQIFAAQKELQAKAKREPRLRELLGGTDGA